MQHVRTAAALRSGRSNKGHPISADLALELARTMDRPLTPREVQMVDLLRMHARAASLEELAAFAAART